MSAKVRSNAYAYLRQSGHYLDEDGNQKTIVLKKFSSSPYNNEIKQLLLDESFFTELDMLATEKHIDAKRMFGISIRFGNHGAPVIVDLKEASSPNKAQLQREVPQAVRP